MCSPLARRRAAGLFVVGAALALGAGCSGSGPDDWWNSACVREQLQLERHLADGAKCYALGYADCGSATGSECRGYCVFDVCQPAQCQADSDCAPLGADFECRLMVLEDLNDDATGLWCRKSDCPKGTLGCPCRADGSCADDPFGAGPMTCAASVCESACPTACRSGSVCCGGAFCSGDCIGTPCCR